MIQESLFPDLVPAHRVLVPDRAALRAVIRRAAQSNHDLRWRMDNPLNHPLDHDDFDQPGLLAGGNIVARP